MYEKKNTSKSESLYDCKQVTDHHAPLYPSLELPCPQSLAGELGVPGDEGLGFVGQLLLHSIQFIIEHQVHVHILLVNGSPDGLNKAKQNLYKTTSYSPVQKAIKYDTQS